jgi:O-antigen biosynthesis protein WbqP
MFPIIKRVIDFLLSLIILISLSILFLILSIVIKVDSKGPVFFKQKRIGKGKKEFHILKFRTMKTDAPKEMPTHKLDKAESYITPVGNFLRKTSLDELPQLINILKGDMSLIGPRPALWNQYDLIEERDKYKANDVLPGLTGLAQISGRDELPIEVKAKIDGDYVIYQNSKLDSEIFVKTIFSVLRSEGVKEGK